LDGAHADYTEVITLNRKDGIAYNNSGAVLTRLNHLGHALADYTAAIELNREDPAAYYNRGRI
jgi:Flp pilus assembly protein TadD